MGIKRGWFFFFSFWMVSINVAILRGVDGDSSFLDFNYQSSGICSC